MVGHLAVGIVRVAQELLHTSGQDTGYCSPQPGDIIVFAGKGHAGMCPGDNISIGSFLTGPIWLINRATLKDAE